ncbi:MAG: DUF2914 domain-containing protein [Deltaproteobacteria bacterium]|nr:DUF2914 domain-containing protein [Deltaproteobacteria bacterium]
MHRVIKIFSIVSISLGLLVAISSVGLCVEGNNPPQAPVPSDCTLLEAVMCEEVSAQSPKNQSTVFSIALGEISCFTLFGSVSKETVVYHYWFRRDTLIKRIQLHLNPPRWRTFSSIELREADKGPWRVEIRDRNGIVMEILRFSITD